MIVITTKSSTSVKPRVGQVANLPALPDCAVVRGRLATRRT